MVSTIVPTDLHVHREQFMQLTGLASGDVGIAPDVRHKKGGGYHCGCQDIVAINKYPTGDYSTRQTRDRVGGNVACAMDKGDNWPNGGREAWIRYNNMVVQQMMRGDPELAALRAINFSPDGKARKRYDSLHPEAGIIDSTDNVEIHTHEEWWRDTAGTPLRARGLARLLEIARAAINNEPLDGEDDEDMGATLTGQVPQYAEFTDEVTGGKVAIGHTIAPGIIDGGAANPRPGWLNFIGDGYGQPFAIRVMFTNGVKDANGNVTWTAPAEGKGSASFKFVSGERLNFALPAGTTAISVLRQAINKGGTIVNVDTSKGLFANPHGLAWSIELGAVKQ